MLVPKVIETEEFLEENGTIEIGVRKKYLSMADMLNSIKSRIIKYYKEVDIEKLKISRDYLYKIKRKRENNNIVNNDFIVKEIELEEEKLSEKKHFSKENIGLIDKNTSDKLKYGF